MRSQSQGFIHRAAPSPHLPWSLTHFTWIRFITYESLRPSRSGPLLLITPGDLASMPRPSGMQGDLEQALWMVQPRLPPVPASAPQQPHGAPVQLPLHPSRDRGSLLQVVLITIGQLSSEVDNKPGPMSQQPHETGYL